MVSITKMETKEKKIAYLQGKLDALKTQESQQEDLISNEPRDSLGYKALYSVWALTANELTRTEAELELLESDCHIKTVYEGVGYSDYNINLTLDTAFDSDELGIFKMDKDLEEQINEYLEEPSLDELKVAIDEGDKFSKNLEILKQRGMDK